MDKALAKISKFLSYVLRHKPESIGLSLDSQGWASIDELISKADFSLDYELLTQAVEQNDKKRFAISEDGLYIRASQGHSINVDLNLQSIQPPDFLYHGTADRFVDSIMETGLQPGQRQHVHLSKDIKTAKSVGQRHGKPIVLIVEAKKMYEQGFKFFISKNEVWLTEKIPAQFLSKQNSE